MRVLLDEQLPRQLAQELSGHDVRTVQQQLKDFLERLFGCRVDLVVADASKPRLRATILSSALLHAAGL